MSKCVVCGCTDDDCSGCVARTGEPCWWFGPDLCSACALACRGLSLWQPWASFVAAGEKTIETRGYRTDYRGPILTCSAMTLDTGWRKVSSRPNAGLCDYAGAHVRGRALAVVNLVDCRPMEHRDQDGSMVRFDPAAKRYSWVFDPKGIIRVTPFPVIGRQRMFTVNETILRDGCAVNFNAW